MINSIKYKYGILAFGSLIDDPGEEIKELEIDRLDSVTPFKIEFARISSSRGKAPTLVPVKDEAKGRKVKSKIIVMNESTSLNELKSILWRRECHITDKTKGFKRPEKPTSKHVLIGELENFYNVEKVIYTTFLPQKEYENLDPEKLADFALSSILSKAGTDKIDGVRYLLSARESGIETEYSERYIKSLLSKTDTSSLQEAIEKLDRQRENQLI
ncbi:hypothetical protein [Owenweeksia hongkongensis]|uniref:hypothetical protein n=1 Tax=Owenweeksia hongkongensis TaxID=253245 RepID=UPI003A938133